jgi:hypothetical protein
LNQYIPWIEQQRKNRTFPSYNSSESKSTNTHVALPFVISNLTLNLWIITSNKKYIKSDYKTNMTLQMYKKEHNGWTPNYTNYLGITLKTCRSHALPKYAPESATTLLWHLHAGYHQSCPSTIWTTSAQTANTPSSNMLINWSIFFWDAYEETLLLKKA